MNSIRGLVHSYLSNYSCFPRAPPMGPLANMLMNTNGGNLSVPGKSPGYRGREFHIQLGEREPWWWTRGHSGLLKRLHLFFGSVATSLSKSADVDNSEPESFSGSIRGRPRRDGKRLHMKYSCCDNWRGLGPSVVEHFPLDVAPTHTHCCSVFECCMCVCVCHKVKQHNDTGPITLGI